MSLENQVNDVENEVNSFFSSLEIRHYPRNLAQWAVLTKSAIEVQKASAVEYGGAKHKAATIVFSRVAALLLDEIANKGTQRFASRRSLQWSLDLDNVTYRALKEGDGYFSAWACFPYWHQKRFTAEVYGHRIKFTSNESSRERQVKAFQKGILRKVDRKSPEESVAPMTSRKAELFEQIVRANEGAKSMRIIYAFPSDLYSELLPWFRDQSELLIRHRDELDLGQYTIKHVKGFLAALQTVCAVHDHLCFLVARRRRDFPVNSAVLIKKRSEWASELSRLSDVDEKTIQEIIGDLTFGVRAPIDLHSELFVELDQNGDLLGLLPHFGLSARLDENLFRTLARKDNKKYNELSEIKEEEMVEELRGASSKSASIFGPYELPKEAQTNLDLVIVDEVASTVLIAELKWIRKPLFVKERIRADEEFLKGLLQLTKLRVFLENNTSYLRMRGALSRDLREYANVHFALVGRDHMVWPATDRGAPLSSTRRLRSG